MTISPQTKLKYVHSEIDMCGFSFKKESWFVVGKADIFDHMRAFVNSLSISIYKIQLFYHNRLRCVHEEFVFCMEKS